MFSLFGGFKSPNPLVVPSDYTRLFIFAKIDKATNYGKLIHSLNVVFIENHTKAHLGHFRFYRHDNNEFFFFDEFNTFIRNQSHNSIILQEPVVAYNIPGYYGGVEVKEMIKISSYVCFVYANGCLADWKPPKKKKFS